MSEDLFTILENNCKNGNHKEVIKTCNKIIKTDKTENENVLIAKSMALIFTNKLKEAFESLESHSSDKINYVKSYILHKQGNGESALLCLQNVSELDASMKELKSQILYKLGRYRESGDIMKQLIGLKDEFIVERQINYLAVNYWNQDYSFLPQNKESYEFLFNQSLLHYRNGEYSTSMDVLKQSLELFYLDEGSCSDQIKLRVHHALLLQLNDKYSESVDVYKEIFSNGFDNSEDHLLAALNLHQMKDSVEEQFIEDIWGKVVESVLTGESQLREIHVQILEEALSHENVYLGNICDNIIENIKKVDDARGLRVKLVAYYFKRGEYYKMEELLGKFMECDESVELVMLRLNMLFIKGHVYEVVDELCGLLSMNPNSPPLLSFLAVLSTKLGKHPNKNCELISMISGYNFDEIVNNALIGGESGDIIGDITVRRENRPKKRVMQTRNVDPERWLPKALRTTKGKKKERVRGPQGIVDNTDRLDINKIVKSVIPPKKQPKPTKGKPKRRRK